MAKKGIWIPYPKKRKFKPVPIERGPRALGQLKHNLIRGKKAKKNKSLARSFIGL